jgi:hypothetical protein
MGRPLAIPKKVYHLNDLAAQLAAFRVRQSFQLLSNLKIMRHNGAAQNAAQRTPQRMCRDLCRMMKIKNVWADLAC